MQDAENAAWKLAAVLKDDVGASIIDSYHAERYPVAKKVITFTTRLSTVGTLGGPLQSVRNALFRVLAHLGPVPRAMARTTTEVDVSYRSSPIVGPSERGASVRAGDHLPFLGRGPVQQAVQHQLLANLGSGHVLLTVTSGRQRPDPVPGNARQVLITDASADSGGGSDAATSSATRTYDAVIPDPHQVLADRLGLHRHGGRVVVRPDSCIGAITSLDDDESVRSYFTDLADCMRRSHDERPTAALAPSRR